jgi:hypothetical protein
MDDPSPSTTTSKKRGRPKGGSKKRGRGENKRLSVRRPSVVKNSITCNKKQDEVVAEPNENYDELSSSDEVAVEVEIPNIDDESDSEIEHGDEDEDDDVDTGNADGLLEFVEERNEPLFDTDIIQRLAIGYMFYKKFGAPENHREWRDRKIRPQIRKAFDLPPGARIDHILNDVVACKKAGIAYTGTRKIGPNTGKHNLLFLRIQWRHRLLPIALNLDSLCR